MPEARVLKSPAIPGSDTPSDPTYGYTLDTLLQVTPPPAPDGYGERWQRWYESALALDPAPQVTDTGRTVSHWRVHEISYRSTANIVIGGWLLVPKSGQVERGFVIGHGYGGRLAPDNHLPFPDSVLLFPCARGISRSAVPQISGNPAWHVLHNIQDPEHYVMRGCAEDLWLGVSTLLQLYPDIAGRLGYLGISFGGGVGAMALAPENRVARAHFNVPSFGHQPLRLELPSVGSAASVRIHARKFSGVASETLQWFDAATSARHIRMPIHFACALADPAVAPPGQFAIHNAVPGEKKLFVLPAGHMEYPNQKARETELLQEIADFFGEM